MAELKNKKEALQQRVTVSSGSEREKRNDQRSVVSTDPPNLPSPPPPAAGGGGACSSGGEQRSQAEVAGSDIRDDGHAREEPPAKKQKGLCQHRPQPVCVVTCVMYVC